MDCLFQTPYNLMTHNMKQIFHFRHQLEHCNVKIHSPNFFATLDLIEIISLANPNFSASNCKQLKLWVHQFGYSHPQQVHLFSFLFKTLLLCKVQIQEIQLNLAMSLGCLAVELQLYSVSILVQPLLYSDLPLQLKHKTSWQILTSITNK